ncbi:MAG: hypothetical protein IT167_25435 [Bryobacterales bacterium]|nr:hypothetical protein [Bryobacterales bacterium]
MTTCVYDVMGLYEHRDEGEKAAQRLRERGFSPVDVLPINEKTLTMLHAGEKRSGGKLLLTALAVPAGFVLGALCATPAALVYGVVFAGPVAFVCGVIGIVLSVNYVNPPAKPRPHSEEAVIVSTCCDPEAREEIVHTFEETRADEVDVIVEEECIPLRVFE